MPTEKKRHDKDKYYFLAKDQGYRARSAFKLIQINKRFDFLSSARVCIDLCAAPGGWCQVASQLMPKGSLILGIDILPIRTIRGVKTLVNDITTAECRRNVQEELKGWSADVVLCDGAPNIGSSYHKDAFVQNELVLAALKTATDHLVKGGTFCTKVYRSTDYNALIWAFQQLFEDVQAIKPNSSRAQSAEIFIVCLRYTKPDKVDPKFVDPNHIFKAIADPGLAKVDVMHKKYEKSNKRQRSGYDWEGGLLTSSGTITSFIQSEEPIRILTDTNMLTFTDECEKYRDNRYTTDEMIECFKDLRVLGKTDFKKILKWRQRMIDWDEMERKEAGGEEVSKSQRREEQEDQEETEETIYEQILEMRAKAAQEDRRLKKKTRELASKERTRQALGMTANVFDGAQEDTEIFSFSKTGRGRKLVESALDEYGENADIINSDSDDSENERRLKNAPVFIEENNLEGELEEDYKSQMRNRKNKDVRDKSNKRDMKDDEQLANMLLEERNREDAMFTGKAKKDAQKRHLEEERKQYEELLTKGSQPETGSRRQARRDKKNQTSNADSSDSSDSSDEEEPSDAEKGSGSDSYELMSDDDDDEASQDAVDDDVERILKSRMNNSRNNQWFSHPIFNETLVENDDNDMEEDDQGNFSDNSDKDDNKRMSKAAQDMIDSMPKTDKQKRAEKRKKEQERATRKTAKRERRDEKARLEEDDGAFFPQKKTKRSKDNEDDDEHSDDEDYHRDEAEEAMRRAPDIRMGMGKIGKDKAGFEIVPRNDDFEELRMDPKDYNSDEEKYTANERAEQLALGTLMLRRGRRKAIIDASYNRFTWNDNTELPSWFTDDEMKHNKPQIPIPPALLEQIKTKFQMTGTKSIKKVAEAKMRKKKHAQAKLKAAKKQANSLAENSEMSEKEKLKAIQRAMKNSKADKPSKVYVVGTKTKAGSSATKTSNGKGKLKFVDKRMKSDKRGEKKASDKKKRGRK
jgi:AdoMet-dependent rRNA methyltransferase SPB1